MPDKLIIGDNSGGILMSEKVMVAGAGKSGISAAKLLLERGGEVFLYDGNTELKEENLKKNFGDPKRVTVKLGELKKSDLEGIKLCVISPGIDLEAPFVKVLNENGVQIWSEIELGYTVSRGTLIAITGTNGKTTTTSLTGEIMKNAFGDAFTVGNIGLPYTETALLTTDRSVTTLEASSFQLETILQFHPHVSAILNITPDHMNRHHTMHNYIRIKESITENQTGDDFCILNYDDKVLNAFGRSGECPAKVVFFSSTHILEDGIDLEDQVIVKKTGGRATPVIRTDELNLLGKHNHENVMAAIAMALCMNVPLSVIRKTCMEFKAVEHRIEFVTERNGVKYFNDSKGTNPDAAIQAVKAMPGPTILIGGGYDKGSTYDEWIEAFGGKVRYLVLIGQTRDAIAECARRHGFTNIMYAEDMQEAVKVCASYAESGDYVLLSPACASWGMFRNYEERGRIFKECVRNL
jgi:UDP-N-acetylmuramoylalanine--D-glutamate ligase